LKRQNAGPLSQHYLSSSHLQHTGAANRSGVLVAYWGRFGAGEKLVQQLVPELRKDPRFAIALSLSRQVEGFADSQDLAPARWHIPTFHGAAGLIGRSAVLPATMIRFVRFLWANRIRAVIVVMPHVWDRALQWAARLAGVRWIVLAHDADQHPGERQAVLDWLQGAELRQADHVVTLSRFVAEGVARRHRLPAGRVTPLFLPTLAYPVPAVSPSQPHPQQPFQLLFFGRLLPYKGVPLLLAAFALLRRAGVEVQLTVAGDGSIDAPDELQNQPGLTVRRGWLDAETIGDLLARADLVVAPYVEASQSGVIAAAYGAGLPVVATPIGGLAEQVIPGETGLVAEAATPEAVAQALRRLIEDPALYRDCREGVERIRATHGWDRFAAALGNVVETTLAQPPR
jgi:glycosyltransferase involved in cell wall biosynthesis